MKVREFLQLGALIGALLYTGVLIMLLMGVHIPGSEIVNLIGPWVALTVICWGWLRYIEKG